MKRKGIIITGAIAVIVCVSVLLFLNSAKVTDNTNKELNINNLAADTKETQNYWHGSAFTKGQGGYYFMMDDYDNDLSKLKFFDSSINQSIYVCGKAECSHDSISCNACFNQKDYLIGKIYYYDNNIYLIKRKNGMSVLERVSIDGAVREEIAELFPNDGTNAVNLVFYDGCAYASDEQEHAGSTQEAVSTIKKVSLSKKTVENVVEYTGVGTNIGKMRSYGNKLFFIVGGVLLDKSTLSMEMNSHMYSYDYNTGELQSVSAMQIYDYCIDTDTNTMYYFVTNDGLYKCNLDTNTTTLVKKADKNLVVGTLSYDGKNIYLSNGGVGSVTTADRKNKIDKKIYVFDKEDNIIREMEIDSSVANIYFGDSSYLFAQNGKDYIYIDKNASWEEWLTIK